MPTNKHGITSELLANEIFWRDHYDHILKHGYRLRSRYKPDWVPSWKYPSGQYTAEDSLGLAHPGGAVTNAWRCSDERPVVLKRVDDDELHILQHLNSLPRIPENRTVPLLDTIHLSDKSEQRLAVMPMFGSFDLYPAFDRLGDLLQALRQLMSGLDFMHKHRVAHRDACLFNFVTDKTHLVPSGFHFSAPIYAPDGKRWIKTRSRSTVHVEYYIIDFDLSLIDPQPGKHGRVGQDKGVPEWRQDSPHYDPYKLDMYQFGSMIQRYFIDSEFVYNAFAFESLQPFVAAMTAEDPAKRPTSAEALCMLEDLAERCPHPHCKEIHWKYNIVRHLKDMHSQPDWRHILPNTQAFAISREEQLLLKEKFRLGFNAAVSG
ncbi:Protein kinase domain-containing protein [Mycena kentingensis (nom. inval.)]|nr:Protein kinase domain-containing protein [Mycena kentingensis (nom. inval.)]